MRVHKCLAFFLSELTKMENLKNFLLKIETKRMRIALIIQRLLLADVRRIQRIDDFCFAVYIGSSCNMGFSKPFKHENAPLYDFVDVVESLICQNPHGWGSCGFWQKGEK